MFSSFFLAGFECSTGWNLHREWFDQISATRHDRYLEEDYLRLKDAGLLAAREGIRWPLVSKGRKYDFSTIEPVLSAAEKTGIELIYDLFHFGYPEDVDIFGHSFPDRFADYCYAVTDFIASQTGGPHYFTPVNEPSYFSWAGGEVGRFRPYAFRKGRELKIRLIQAAIKGIDAIREACGEARFIHADALCRVVAPRGRTELQEQVDSFNDIAVFESWDMLAGKMLPELGGSDAHLDIVGVNYYWTNQWELTQPDLPLDPNDERSVTLSDLLSIVWQRYGHIIVITETSHIGDGRAEWLRQLSDEVQSAIEKGVPLQGVCLYPVLSMPEWHDRSRWTNMGLWDLHSDGTHLKRVLNQPMFVALKEAQLQQERFAAQHKLQRRIG